MDQSFFSYESSMIRNGKLEISHCDYVQNCVRNGKKLVELFGVSTNTTTAMIMHGIPQVTIPRTVDHGEIIMLDITLLQYIYSNIDCIDAIK